MTALPAAISSALALLREYEEAYERGEEPEFPHEAERVVREFEMRLSGGVK